MPYTIPDLGLVKQVIHTAYDMSFAKANALCRDAGMTKMDSESCLWHLAKSVHEGKPVDKDAIRAHLILERHNREKAEKAARQ